MCYEAMKFACPSKAGLHPAKTGAQGGGPLFFFLASVCVCGGGVEGLVGWLGRVRDSHD